MNSMSLGETLSVLYANGDAFIVQLLRGQYWKELRRQGLGIGELSLVNMGVTSILLAIQAGILMKSIHFLPPLHPAPRC